MLKERSLKVSVAGVFMIFLAAQALPGRRASAFSSGPPTARTGAPGEITCAICHNSFPLNSGPGALSLTGLPASYSPNQELALTLTLNQANRNLYGFQLTVLDDSGRQAGTLIVTDDTRTQMGLDAIDGKLRQYLNHTLQGTFPTETNQGSWSFKWRAPAASVGRVTFYAAGNAANGNGGSSGDYIYTNSFTIDSPGVQGYEADVAPRPNGNNNGTVTIADWAQVGRFAAGLDTAEPGSEFQRADCAPSATSGDGSITIADWVQAGRYAAGLDPVVPAGGPVGPSTLRALAPSGDPIPAAVKSRGAVGLRVSRDLRGRWGAPFRTFFVIELEAQGNENALGFSVSFDPRRFRFTGAAPADGLPGATFNVNHNQEASGRVGFSLALPAGESLAKGKHEIVVLTFLTFPAAAGSDQIVFGDWPVFREIVDVNANAARESGH